MLETDKFINDHEFTTLATKHALLPLKKSEKWINHFLLAAKPNLPLKCLHQNRICSNDLLHRTNWLWENTMIWFLSIVYNGFKSDQKCLIWTIAKMRHFFVIFKHCDVHTSIDSDNRNHHWKYENGQKVSLFWKVLFSLYTLLLKLSMWISVS